VQVFLRTAVGQRKGEKNRYGLEIILFGHALKILCRTGALHKNKNRGIIKKKNVKKVFRSPGGGLLYMRKLLRSLEGSAGQQGRIESRNAFGEYLILLKRERLSYLR